MKKLQMQSKLQSVAESLVNIGIRGIISIVSQLLLFPKLGIHVGLSVNILIWGYFTVISLVTSYMIRRYFNSKLDDKRNI